MAPITRSNTNIAAFFQGVEAGSVDTLKELQLKIGPKQIARISALLTPEGETPLLLAIRRNHFEMIKFLVEEVKVDTYQFGRLIRNGMMDYTEVPPLFAAIIFDHTPDQRIANFLIDYQQKNIISTVQKSSSIPLNQKLDILELIGAALILKTPFFQGTLFSGLSHWLMRFRLSDCGPPEIPKPSNLSQLGRNVFGNATVFSTVEEVLSICTSFREEKNLFIVETQALLAIHRTMSQFDSGPYPYFLHRLSKYSQDWFDDEELQRKIDSAVFALESLEVRQWQDVVNFDVAYRNIVEDSLNQMLVTSAEMRSLPNHSELGFANVVKTLNLASSFASKMRMHPQLYDWAVRVVSLIICNVKHMYPLNLREQVEWKKWITDYVKNVEELPAVGRSILHQFCSFENPIPIHLIQLFLSAGANPNCIDVDGSAPLHLLAQSVSADNISVALKLLLDAGANLDKVNARGVTPHQLFMQNLSQYKSQDVEGPNVFSLINLVRSLSCYSAQVICKERIPFERESVPPPVFSFIRFHGANI